MAALIGTCATCIFWVSGTCHRHAPSPVFAAEGIPQKVTWPVVQASESCGEWSVK